MYILEWCTNWATAELPLDDTLPSIRISGVFNDIIFTTNQAMVFE